MICLHDKLCVEECRIKSAMSKKEKLALSVKHHALLVTAMYGSGRRYSKDVLDVSVK